MKIQTLKLSSGNVAKTITIVCFLISFFTPPSHPSPLDIIDIKQVNDIKVNYLKRTARKTFESLFLSSFSSI